MVGQGRQTRVEERSSGHDHTVGHQEIGGY
jgi:phosphopentomutase